MSLEDETELKDLLMQTLSENGCLAKIKAQLRASVFLALEEDLNLSSQKPFMNEKVKSSLRTPEGQLMFCIVKEFLEYFNLQSTMAVFDAESYLGISYDYEGRKKILKDLGVKSEDESAPLLKHLVQLQHKPKIIEVNLNINGENSGADNDITSSSNSIKTETSLSEGGSEGTKRSSNIVHDVKEISCDHTSEFKYENDFNESFNKTFTTDTKHASNNSEDSINNISGDFRNDIEANISQVISTDVQTPLFSPIEEVTPPILKDKLSPERVKSPPKSDKLKSKNNLNSLSDLPPLNINKSISGRILPSLYNKEFREKPNS